MISEFIIDKLETIFKAYDYGVIKTIFLLLFTPFCFIGLVLDLIFFPVELLFIGYKK